MGNSWLGPVVFTIMSIVLLLFMLGGGEVIFRFNPVPWINLTITTGAVSQSLLVLCRVFGCSVSLFFIVLTTPMTDLFNGMKRIGIPIELIDPAIPEEIRHTVDHVDGVLAITEVRVRWLGHRLHAEVNITVHSSLSVEEGHAIAREYQHELLHHLRYLSDAAIHVDPATASGLRYHHIQSHHHDGLPEHSH
jgi:hypothetical protein